MTKPTREEVKELQACLEEYKHDAPWREYTLNLCNAYLSQEEELENYADIWSDTLKQNEALKAENQAIKASMEAEYIERQAKHIQALVKENEALKAGSLRLEA